MTEGDTSTEASAALLWDEARRQVERQESSLESLKTRGHRDAFCLSLGGGILWFPPPSEP